MANQGVPFTIDSFGGMQQQLQDQQQQQQVQVQQQQQQQALRGVASGLAQTWSEVPEQYRQANVNPSQLGQQPSAAHQQQLNQTHQAMAQSMGMMTNRDLAPQLHRQTPRMQHTLMNQQSQYPQLAHAQFQHANIPQNIPQNSGLNQNPNAANQAHLMSVPQQSRQTPTMQPFTPPGGSFNQANPGMVRQLQNLNTGIANGATQVQLQSYPGQNFGGPQQASNQLTVLLNQSARAAQQFETHLPNALNEARSSVGARDIKRMLSCREQVNQFKNKAQDEKENWSKFAQSRPWPHDAREMILKEADRFQAYEGKCEQILKLIEDAMRGFQQLTATNVTGMGFQANRASMTGQTQQPQQWNGAQRNNVGMGQTNPGQQNFPTSNLTNQTFPQFGNPLSTSGGQPSNMGAMTHQMGTVQTRLNGGIPPSNVPADQDPNTKINFLKILQAAGLEGSVFVAGHAVDLWQLYCLVKRFNPVQMQHPNVFRLIGGQIGLPSEGSPALASPQAAAALQEHYNKVNTTLDNARSNTRMNPNLNPAANITGNPMANLNSNLLNPTPAFNNHGNALPSPAQQAQQAQANDARLHAAIATYHFIDFSEFTRDVVTNLPAARFDHKLRQFISEQINNHRAQGAGSAAQRGGMPPGPNSAMVPGVNGGHMSQNSQGQEGQVQHITPEQAQEILKIQQDLIKTWRDAFHQAKLEPIPQPPNQMQWRQMVQLTVHVLRNLLPGLGLYFFVTHKKNEVNQVVQVSARIVKQMLSLQSPRPSVHFFTMQQLQTYHALLQSRAQEMTVALERIRVPQELRSMVSPTEAESKTLWGFMPQTTLQQPQQQPFNPAIPTHMTPNLHHNAPNTPTPLPEEERPFIRHSPRFAEEGLKGPRHGSKVSRAKWYITVILFSSLLALFAGRRYIGRAYTLRKCNAAIAVAGIPEESVSWNMTQPEPDLPIDRWARVVHPDELMSMVDRGEHTGSRIIHQSWKTRDNLPQNFKAWSQRWRSLHDSSWMYVLWTDEDNRNLVERYYPEYLSAYDSLPKEIHRADMVRNMYMHRFGGVYADLDLTPLVSLSRHISIPSTNESSGNRTAYVGRMSSEEFEHSIPNAFLASTAPFHPFWIRPLQFVRDDSTWYYRRPEDLTGPIALRTCVNGWIKDAENQSNELKIIEAGKIYPFTWNDSPLSSKCICDPRNPTFDSRRCHRLYSEAWTITYWTRSWNPL